MQGYGSYYTKEEGTGGNGEKAMSYKEGSTAEAKRSKQMKHWWSCRENTHNYRRAGGSKSWSSRHSRQRGGSNGRRMCREIS